MIDHEVTSGVGLISSVGRRFEGCSVFEVWVFEGYVWLGFWLRLVV